MDESRDRGPEVSLAELQVELSHFLYTQRPGLQRAESLIAQLSDRGPVAPEAGLRVYRGNLLVGVVEELRRSFPRTRAHVGASAFDDTARSFLYASDAAERELGELGEAFATYLAALASPEVADLAALESAQERAYLAPDDEPIDEARLAALSRRSPARARLALRSSIHLLRPRFPVHRERWETPESDLRLVVWRQAGRHRVDSVEPELWPVLKAIDAGKSLEEIAALPELALEPRRLEECLAVLLTRQWLRG